MESKNRLLYNKSMMYPSLKNLIKSKPSPEKMSSRDRIKLKIKISMLTNIKIDKWSQWLKLMLMKTQENQITKIEKSQISLTSKKELKPMLKRLKMLSRKK